MDDTNDAPQQEIDTVLHSPLANEAAAPLHASQLDQEEPDFDDGYCEEEEEVKTDTSVLEVGSDDDDEETDTEQTTRQPIASAATATCTSTPSWQPGKWRTTRRTPRMIEYEYDGAGSGTGAGTGIYTTQSINTSDVGEVGSTSSSVVCGSKCDSHEEALRRNIEAARRAVAPTMTISGCKLYFPSHSKPFPSQKAVMSKIISAVLRRKNALIESPTGTGKTLAILSACLSWQRSQILDVLKKNLAVRSAKAKQEKRRIAEESERVAEELKKAELNKTEQESKENNNEKGEEHQEETDQAAEDDSNEPDEQDNDEADEETSKEKVKEDKQSREGNQNDDDRENNNGHEENGERSNQDGEEDSTVEDEECKQQQQDTGNSVEKPGENKTEPEPDLQNSPSDKEESEQPLQHRIIYASRTHGQLQQISDEIRQCDSAAFWSEQLHVDDCDEDTLVNFAENYRKPFLRVSVNNDRKSLNVAFSTKSTVLASRDRCCVNTKSVKRTPRAPSIREQCSSLLTAGKCAHFKNRKRLGEQMSPICDLEEVDRLVAHAKKSNSRKRAEVPGCPYFAIKDRIPRSTVIACPYSYLIDPVVRRSSGLSDIIPGSVIICDEGHNIEDTACEAAGFTSDVPAMKEASEKLKQVFEDNGLLSTGEPLLNILNSVVNWAHSNKNFLPPSSTGGIHEHSWEPNDLLSIFMSWGITPATLPVLQESLRSVSEKLAEILREAQGDNQEESEVPVGDTSASFLSTVERLLTATTFALQSGKDPEKKEELPYLDAFRLNLSHNTFTGIVSLSLSCFDAEPCIAEISHAARSMIILSGTLAPLEKSDDEFGVPFEQKLSASHVVDGRRQIYAGVVSDLSPVTRQAKLTFQTLSNTRMLIDIGNFLVTVARCTPGGIIVFAPSFFALRTLSSQWKSQDIFGIINTRCNKGTYIDDYDPLESNSRQEYMQGLIEGFKNDCAEDSDRDGAVLFTVCRGQMSEGINLKDSYCRSVIILGVPFPALKDWKVVSKKKYQERKLRRSTGNIRSGEDWYLAKALRATSQAAGRAIRHKDDWGSIFFVDSRYNQKRFYEMIPRWMQDHVRRDLSMTTVAHQLSAFSHERLGHEYVPREPPTTASSGSESDDSPNEKRSRAPSAGDKDPNSTNNKRQSVMGIF